MLRHRTLTGLAGLFAVTLVGCGSSSDSGTPNACDLLSTDEASDIMGTPALDGEEDTDRTIGGSFCSWRAEGTPSGEDEPAYSIYIDIAGERGARDFAADQEDDDSAPATGIPAEPVTGIGDEAYFYAFGDTQPSLHVRVGDDYLTLGVSDDDEHEISVEQAEAMERQMAEFALPHFD